LHEKTLNVILKSIEVFKKYESYANDMND
jgi:hypothetical protein